MKKIVINNRIARIDKIYSWHIWRLIFEDNKEIVNVFYADNSDEWTPYIENNTIN